MTYAPFSYNSLGIPDWLAQVPEFVADLTIALSRKLGNPICRIPLHKEHGDTSKAVRQPSKKNALADIGG